MNDPLPDDRYDAPWDGPDGEFDPLPGEMFDTGPAADLPVLARWIQEALAAEGLIAPGRPIRVTTALIERILELESAWFSR